MQFRAFQSEGVKKQGFSQTIFSFSKKDIFKNVQFSDLESTLR